MVAPPQFNLSQSVNGHIPVLEVQGGLPLHGEVIIGGAKNSALLIMAGALLCPGVCRIRNVPSLPTIEQMGAIVSALGVKLTQAREGLELDAEHLHQTAVPPDLCHPLRASFLVMAPLLTRFGTAQIPLPAGCPISASPVNLHIQGLEAMGATIQMKQGIVHAELRQGQRLRGTKMYLSFPSVGATATLLMAATLADGETVIENAAREPEIADLANFCRAMGARIRGEGTATIQVVGVSELHPADYRIIPDRIEAGTVLIAGAITRSPLVLTSVNPRHLMSVTTKLREIGTAVVADSLNQLRIVPGQRHQATPVKTLPYPGFPTDMQAPLMALLSLSQGQSTLIETVFENRMRQAVELNRLGADIRVKDNYALIRGVSRLTGTSVIAMDERTMSALILAGLAAEGVTTIHHSPASYSTSPSLDRSSEHLVEKLCQVGAALQRLPLTSPSTELRSDRLSATAAASPDRHEDTSFYKAEVA